MSSSSNVAETNTDAEPGPASRACQSKPRDISPASCQSKPRDISPASCQSKPRDISPASCQSKPRDISPASCQSKPRDISPASCQSKPRDISPASCQSKPRDISPASRTSLSKPRDKRETLSLMKEDFLNVFKEKEVRGSGSEVRGSGSEVRGSGSEVRGSGSERSQLNVLRDDLDLFKNELAIFTGDITGILRRGLRRDGPFTIKEDSSIADTAPQEQRRREKEDAAKIKVQVKSRRERDTEESFTIRARTKRGGAGRGNGFKLKEEEVEEEGEKEVSFKIKASVSEKLCAEGETPESFKKKESGLRKSGEDFKIRAQIKQGGSSDTTDGSFKVKEESSDEFSDWEMVRPEKTTEEETDADPLRVGGRLTQMDPLISVSSGVSLLRLRDITLNLQRGEVVDDMWTIKNFAQYLTLDPNTANPELVLTHGNRRARREWSRSHVSEHPERFKHCPQVLCREGLLDVVYWEVQWTEGVDVGVAYNSLRRQGPPTEGLLGLNQDSWSLECGHGGYTACHGNQRSKWVCPEPFSQTVGLFLDFEAGSLSFFCVSPGSMQHLHTFRTSFTEPLYPGFWLWSWGGSVSLHQVELGWESLL